MNTGIYLPPIHPLPFGNKIWLPLKEIGIVLQRKEAYIGQKAYSFSEKKENVKPGVVKINISYIPYKKNKLSFPAQGLWDL